MDPINETASQLLSRLLRTPAICNTDMTRDYVLAILTLLVCIAIAGVALCRLRLTNRRIRIEVRIKYTLLGSGAIVFGFSPWTGEWPGWTGLLFSLAVFAGLASSWRRWQHHAPIETHSDFARLEREMKSSPSTTSPGTNDE